MSRSRRVVVGLLVAAVAVSAAVVALRQLWRQQLIDWVCEFARESDGCRSVTIRSQNLGLPSLLLDRKSDICLAGRLHTPDVMPLIYRVCRLPKDQTLSARAAFARAIDSDSDGPNDGELYVVGVFPGSVRSFDSFDLKAVNIAGPTATFQIDHLQRARSGEKLSRPAVAFFALAVPPGVRQMNVRFEQFEQTYDVYQTAQGNELVPKDVPLESRRGVEDFRVELPAP